MSDRAGTDYLRRRMLGDGVRREVLLEERISRLEAVVMEAHSRKCTCWGDGTHVDEDCVSWRAAVLGER